MVTLILACASRFLRFPNGIFWNLQPAQLINTSSPEGNEENASTLHQ